MTGLRYELTLRPYSLAGDNCQQFILQFCREIGVEFDQEAMQQLGTATGLARAIRLCVLFLVSVFLVDLVFDKGRLILATPLTPTIGFLALILITLAHPRIFLSDFSYLGFTLAHLLYLFHSGIVWLMWIFLGVWMAFSVENTCDDVCFSVENGETIFDYWHPCNVVLRLFQAAIFVIALAGAIYHDFYSIYFVVDK
jgi:hypothetical protein